MTGLLQKELKMTGTSSVLRKRPVSEETGKSLGVDKVISQDGSDELLPSDATPATPGKWLHLAYLQRL
jgi:hypothetical protein